MGVGDQSQGGKRDKETDTEKGSNYSSSPSTGYVVLCIVGSKQSAMKITSELNLKKKR